MKMSRVVVAAWIAIMAAVLVLPLTAQEASSDQGSQNKSAYYYVSLPVEKVFSYRLGYVVYYRKGPTSIARTYLPNEWFSNTAGKGEIIYLEKGNTWPSLMVYYKDGIFSHVRLSVRREMTHESWGIIPSSVNLDNEFEGLEEIKLEF
ncbi:MAG: hypothetical protein LBG76_07240 [Treponema sp.]|jgi:hypothetical protein|nr:hypothetical protein [Treponema sp.]